MNEEKTFRGELRIIPGVAWVIAVMVFVAIQMVLPVMIRRQPKPPPPVPVQLIAPVLLGVICAAYVLLIGYVVRDAKRRAMDRRIWVPVVIFVPNALGFVLYFLLRRPILDRCPKCSALVREGSTYCQNCGEKLAPTCPSCGRPVDPGTKYCSHCGSALRKSEPAVQT